MNIVVCVKRVPETAEADLRITSDGTGIDEGGLAFQINESDNYALEEALLIKERVGGTVTVVTLGSEASEEVLRMSMAKGADSAIRLAGPEFEGSDPAAIAKALAAAIGELEFDLVLTGCMSSDMGYTQVGVALAEHMGLPHATYVTEMEIADGSVTVGRELEGGLIEKLDMGLPSVVTIQTGINEPRYASIMGIAKAAKREISLRTASDLTLEASAVGAEGSQTEPLELLYPPVGEGAQLLEGTPAEASEKLAQVLKEKGFA